MVVQLFSLLVYSRVAQIPIPRRFSGSGFPNFWELGIGITGLRSRRDGIEISSGRDSGFFAIFPLCIFLKLGHFFKILTIFSKFWLFFQHFRKKFTIFWSFFLIFGYFFNIFAINFQIWPFFQNFRHKFSKFWPFFYILNLVKIA